MGDAFVSISPNEQFIVTQGYNTQQYNDRPPIGMQLMITYLKNMKKFYIIRIDLTYGGHIGYVMEEIEEVISLLDGLSRLHYNNFHSGLFYNRTDKNYRINKIVMSSLLNENENFGLIVPINNEPDNIANLLLRLKNNYM